MDGEPLAIEVVQGRQQEFARLVWRLMMYVEERDRGGYDQMASEVMELYTTAIWEIYTLRKGGDHTSTGMSSESEKGGRK